MTITILNWIGYNTRDGLTRRARQKGDGPGIDVKVRGAELSQVTVRWLPADDEADGQHLTKITEIPLDGWDARHPGAHEGRGDRFFVFLNSTC